MSMDSKLVKAINNNHGLYQAVFKHHSISLQFNNDVAYTTKKAPPYYSNLVTRCKEWQPDAIFQQIDNTYHQEGWQEWSIKDSFQVLELTTYGFTKLFDAEWMYLERDKFKPSAANHLHYKLIQSEEGLEQWRSAWDSDIEVGKAIFTPSLLTNACLYFVAGYDKVEIVTGCVINKTEDVLGISNFFAPDQSLHYWSTLISFIHTSIEKKDLVGYERVDVVSRLNKLGVEPIGNLSVWLKKKQS